MDAIGSIRKLGFRKWYERTMLRSHGNLVLLLLSTIGLLVGAEAYQRDMPASTQLSLLACALAAGAIGYWSLRRYFQLMREAEFAADQAVCRQCDVYGRWDVATEDRQRQSMYVRCRNCGNVWKIALFAPDLQDDVGTASSDS